MFVFDSLIIRIRQKTWERLKSLRGGTFTTILQNMLAVHETISLLTLPHYHALERRLKIIYATVVMCQKMSNESIFKWFTCIKFFSSFPTKHGLCKDELKAVLFNEQLLNFSIYSIYRLCILFLCPTFCYYLNLF